MKNLYVLLFTVLFVQGCATAYQKSSFTGGYSETQLDENVFRVSFRGNGYTGREKVADFTLLRNAELALENGYQYFAIVDANSYTTNSTYTTPATTYGSATTYGGQTYNISKPSSSNYNCMLQRKAKLSIYI